MKLTSLLALAILLLTSVGCASSKVINGKTYPPYGVANKEQADPAIYYEIPTGNFVLGVVFAESIIIPAYIICLDLYEPVSAKAIDTRAK